MFLQVFASFCSENFVHKIIFICLRMQSYGRKERVREKKGFFNTLREK
jgi:hypothetical protein